MLKRLFLNLISFVLLLTTVSSYIAVSPTWLTSPYFRAGNQKVINSNTNSASTPTYAFTFSSAMTGTPNLAYGIKNYRGTDRLKSTNFEIKRVSLSASTFTVSIQLFGSGKLFLLAVPYIAIDPTFPHHLNSFDNVAIEYTSTLSNITVSSASTTSFSQTINYTLQSAANTYKTFTTPLSSNKIVLFITSLCVVANSTAAFNMDISYSILSSSHYSWTVTVYQYATVSKLHFSSIIYNQDDVSASGLYEIVNQYWTSDGSANYRAFPVQLVDNMILGLTDFHAANGNCGLDYRWDFWTNISGMSYAIYFSISQPAPNSTANGGQNYIRSTLFYIKTWDCSASYSYYNLTSGNCQDTCASYYYFNTSALTCTTCDYTCYNCSLANSATSCTACESGLYRELVSNACVCKAGYFADGFQPACKACSAVDPNSLTCTYTIDSSLATTIYQTIFASTSWASDILVNFTSVSCASKYFVNTSRLCQSCPSYCLTCTDATTCTSCDSTVSATLYTDNLCYLCAVSNCTSCYPANVCISCSTGYVVDSGACITCIAACTCSGYVLPKVNGACSTLCGDGYLVGTEQCDDGNTVDHDGCSSTCTIQTCALNCSCDGWTAPWVTANSSCTSVCGDGYLRGVEQCDDGNTIDGDGCSSTCVNQSCSVSCLCDGWTLPVVSGVCSTTCGDGFLRGTQECDDGNTIDHDGCSSTCTTETCALNCSCDGWVTPWVTANTSCTSVCGDGYLRGDEQCDDGNTVDHDGCSSTCLTQVCAVSCTCDGWTAPWVTANSSCTSVCGDSLLRGVEQCDDGNTVDHDGCSSTCLTQTCDLNCSCDGWTAPWTSGACTPVCGDGLLRGTEQCDDGNTIDHDGCSSTCTTESCAMSCLCGGWTLPWISADNSCTSVCGDGFVVGKQQCDDGNILSGDGCNITCIVQITEQTALLTSGMSQYPSLILFLMGFRIVGLQMLNVFQSFQLIMSSLQLTTLQLSFNIHGYSDQTYFPLPIPINNHIFTHFNFMYLSVIGLFVVAVMFQLYYAVCHKSNRILDADKSNDQQTEKSDVMKSNSEEDHSEEISDFTVHYKSQRKLPNKNDLNNSTRLDQSQVLKPTIQQQTFWGCVIFRQFFYNLLVNLLCVFVFSFVEQIRIVSIGSFINFETMAVVVSMIFLIAVVLTVCAVENHSFGENHLKFHHNQAIEYWVLMIGEKVVFAAILASKQFWSLEALLAVKFVLLGYYACTSLYFQTIQKVRSVVTHLLHFLLILAITLNEQFFKPNNILEIFPTFFMEYIYIGLLAIVLLICFAFYIRQIMYCCQADFRHDGSGQVFAIVNGAISAVFDVKNSDIMEDSAHPFNITTMKGSNIYDDLKSKKLQKSPSIQSPEGLSHHGGGAMAKKVVSINTFNHMLSPPASATSNVQFASISKKHFQTHKRNPIDHMKINPLQQQFEGHIQEVDIPKKSSESPKPSKSNLKKNTYKQQDIKLSFERENSPNNSLQIYNPNKTETKSFKKPARRVAMKNRRRQAENQKNFKTDEDLDVDCSDNQLEQKVQPIFRHQNPLNQTKKHSRPLTFQSRKNRLVRQQSPQSLGDRGPKLNFESQNIAYNFLDSKIESQDAFSITFQ